MVHPGRRGGHDSLLGEGPAYSTDVGLSEPQCPHQGLELALRGGGELLALSWACLDFDPCPPSPDIGFEQTFPAGSGAGDSTQMAAPGSATGACSWL